MQLEPALLADSTNQRSHTHASAARYLPEYRAYVYDRLRRYPIVYAQPDSFITAEAQCQGAISPRCTGAATPS